MMSMRTATILAISGAILGLVANIAWMVLGFITLSPDIARSANAIMTDFSYVASLFSNIVAVMFFVTFYRHLNDRK